MKGSGIKAKDLIFLNSINSKKNYKTSDSNEISKKTCKSDNVEETKRRLIQEFDLEALLNSSDATIVKVNRVSGNPEEEFLNDKGNNDNAKKKKRKNNVSKKQKVHEQGGFEGMFVEKLELHIEVDKSKKIKKNNTVSVEGNTLNDDGLLSLRTRASPKVINNLMKNLTLGQRKNLIDMGFGSLYDMDIEEIPVKIGHFVVDKFIDSEMKLKLRDYDIVITPELIHKVLDVPLGGIDFNDLDKIRRSDLSERWYSQFGSIRYPTPNKVAEVVQKTDVEGILFNLNILVLFSNFFGLGGTAGQCRPQQILNYIHEDTKIESIDWCKYVFDCLKASKENWVRDGPDNYSSHYSGPLTALIVSVHFHRLLLFLKIYTKI